MHNHTEGYYDDEFGFCIDRDDDEEAERAEQERDRREEELVDQYMAEAEYQAAEREHKPYVPAKIIECGMCHRKYPNLPEYTHLCPEPIKVLKN